MRVRVRVRVRVSVSARGWASRLSKDAPPGPQSRRTWRESSKTSTPSQSAKGTTWRSTPANSEPIFCHTSISALPLKGLTLTGTYGGDELERCRVDSILYPFIALLAPRDANLTRRCVYVEQLEKPPRLSEDRGSFARKQ